jgi:hypothetical protein
MAEDERDPVELFHEATQPRLDESGRLTCDVCGRTFTKNGLGIHKARAHGSNWASGRKPAKPRRNTARAAKPPVAPQTIVLREAWHDKNGRILLTDQDGNWWVARKLDV